MDRDAWPQLAARLERRFAERTRDQWMETFSRLDACVAPVLGLDEAPEHEHNRARSGFLSGPDQAQHVAPAPRFSRTPGSIRTAAPSPGADRDRILADAGYRPEEIQQLQREGAFGAGEPPPGEKEQR